jgi:cytochrome c
MNSLVAVFGSRTKASWIRRARAYLLALLALVAQIASEPGFAAGPVWSVQGGDPQRAPKLIVAFGCSACHAVPGVTGADGNVGPPLTRFGERTYIAGMLRNNPSNLIRWIRDPQGVIPGNAMPNMGVSEADARDIAAYLYTLR